MQDNEMDNQDQQLPPDMDEFGMEGLEDIEEPQPSEDEMPMEPEGLMHASVTLATLAASDATRLPKPSTVCEQCPNSVWFSSPQEVRCYCRVMYVTTWTTKEPNVITGCDGMFLGQED